MKTKSKVNDKLPKKQRISVQQTPAKAETPPVTESSAMPATTATTEDQVATQPIVLSMPTIKIPTLKTPPIPVGDLRAVIEEKLKNCEETRKTVKDCLEYLLQIRQFVDSQQDRTAKRMAEEDAVSEIQRIENYLLESLGHTYIHYRRAAAEAYLHKVFAQTPATLNDCRMTLQDLLDRKILVDDSNGPVIIGYKHYSISDKFGMVAEDVAEINNVVADFSRQHKALVGQQRIAQAEEAQKKVTVTFEKVWYDHVNGVCMIDIPPEQMTNGRWRAGGQLLAQFTQNDVIPLKGIGGIESLIRDMVSLNVVLAAYTLDWNNPPGADDGHYRSMINNLMNVHRLLRPDAEEYVNKVTILWHLIQRGVKKLDSDLRLGNLRAEFNKRATIRPAQFFRLNGDGKNPSSGMAYLEFRGAYQVNRDTSICNVFFLVEIVHKDLPNGQSDEIRIVEIPEHAANLLGPFVNKWYKGIEKCPSGLSRILKAIHDQEESAAEINRGEQLVLEKSTTTTTPSTTEAQS